MSFVQKVIHVAAYQSSNRGLGYEQKLLYQLKSDLAHFQRLTKNQIVIMGRKTHESIGRLLPHRISIILSKNPAYAVDGAYIFHELEPALLWCRQHFADKHICIIGGGTLYAESLEKGLVDELQLTEIDGHLHADTFYPYIDLNTWLHT
jgi:dihydrofolate reductase